MELSKILSDYIHSDIENGFNYYYDKLLIDIIKKNDLMNSHIKAIEIDDVFSDVILYFKKIYVEDFNGINDYWHNLISKDKRKLATYIEMSTKEQIEEALSRK